MITEQQLDQFNNEGCVAIPGFLSQDEVKEILDESSRLLDNLDLSSHPMTKFSTAEDDENHVGDNYFLDSSNKIHYFFEVDSIDSEGRLKKPKELCVNKIGHGLHFLNPKFEAISRSEKVAEIAKKLNFKDPRILQSMLILKPPEIGGKVPSHQDGEFLYTTPQSCVGFWFALEDCTIKNGCLSFVPGSHKDFPISKRFVKDKPFGTKFIDTGATAKAELPKEEEFKCVEIPAGTLVLIHSSVLHKSEKNVSNKSRFAYTFHCIEGEAEYDELNWLQIPPVSETGGKAYGTKYITKLIV